MVGLALLLSGGALEFSGSVFGNATLDADRNPLKASSGVRSRYNTCQQQMRQTALALFAGALLQ
jgi:hypothetical protein